MEHLEKGCKVPFTINWLTHICDLSLMEVLGYFQWDRISEYQNTNHLNYWKRFIITFALDQIKFNHTPCSSTLRAKNGKGIMSICIAISVNIFFPARL